MDEGPRALLPYLAAVLAIQALLVGVYAAFPDTQLFDLDEEYTLPAWFSGLQLAAIGVACFFAFEAERRDRSAPLSLQWVWPLLGLGFLYLSADEILAIHERVLTDTLRRLLPADSLLQAVLPWQLVFAPVIVVAFVLVSVVASTRLGLRRGGVGLALAGLGLWAGSFVLEGAAKPLFIPARLYRLEVVLEEWAEMLGGTCILAAFAGYALSRLRGTAAPVRAVRWGWVCGAAGGLCVTAAVAIAVFTLSNPTYLFRRAGDKFVKKHEYAQAITAYDRALSLRPRDADLWGRLARAALLLRRYPTAADAYRKALALGPGTPKLHVNLGVALHHAGDIDAAVAAYGTALRLDPDYARAHKNLGVALESRGDLAGAEEHYRLATAGDRHMADAYRYLGNLLQRQGRLREAREAWQHSIDADPEQKQAAKLRRLIQQTADDALSGPGMRGAQASDAA